MGISLVTAATSGAITLAEAKAHLRVTTSDDDSYIYALITAAGTWIENDLRRKLLSQTWDYSLREFPDGDSDDIDGVAISFPFLPIQSITSIKYIDPDGTEQTLSSSLYVSDFTGTVALVEPSYGNVWPSIRADIPNAVVVRFVAGYTTATDVPEPIRQAVKILVGQMFENREITVIGASVSQIEFAVSALIDPYRVAL